MKIATASTIASVHYRVEDQNSAAIINRISAAAGTNEYRDWVYRNHMLRRHRRELEAGSESHPALFPLSHTTGQAASSTYDAFRKWETIFSNSSFELKWMIILPAFLPDNLISTFVPTRSRTMLCNCCK